MRQWQVLLLASGVTVAAHVCLLAGGWLLAPPASHMAADAAPTAASVLPPLRAHTPLKWTLLPPPRAMASGALVAVPATPAPLSREQAATAVAATPAAAATVRAAASTASPKRNQTHYWSPAEVDFRAWPVSPPDAQALAGLAWSADAPVRLRLLITAQGQAVKVEALGQHAPPDEVLNALSDMFKATRFMPARRQGQDVASLQDIEILPERGESGEGGGGGPSTRQGAVDQR